MAILVLGPASIDLERGAVERAGATVRLAVAEVAVLEALAAGELVDRATLEQVAGSGRALRRALEGLRRKLGPHASGRIESRRGHGYQLDLREGADRRTNVPPARSAILGREAALVELRAALAAGFVCLTGPPGVGKSRLARELARELAIERPGGAWWVPLLHATRADQVVSAVAEVLDIPLESARADQRRAVLEAALPHAGRALLVLDDVDALGDELAPLLQNWAEVAPGLSMVATSRRTLGHPEERVVRLGPLATADAVALLADRSGLELGPGAELIAARLDNLPLALELVAARLTLLGSESLVAMDPATLVGGALEAAIDASVADLSPEVARVLGALACFPADFDVEAARAVAGAGVIEALVELERRSLLDREDREGGPRYALLHAIQQRVLETLPTPDQRAADARRHAEHYAELGTRALAELRRTGASVAMQTLATEREHLRQASLHPDPAIAARAMVAFAPLVGPRLGFGAFEGPLQALEARGSLVPEPLAVQLAIIRGVNTGRTVDYRRATEILEVAHARAEALGERALLGRACTALGTALLRSGERERALELHRRGASLASSVGDQAMRSAALVMVAENQRLGQDLDGAIETYREVLEVAEAAGDHRGIANVLANWGGLAAALAHPDADALLERAARLAAQHRDRRVVAYVDGVRARLDMRRGDAARARERVESALAIQTELGLRRNRAASLVYLAEISVLASQLDRAEALYAEALRVHTELGDRLWVALDTANLGLLALARGRVDQARRDVQQALASLEALHHRHEALARLILAAIEATSGDPEAARDHYERCAPALLDAAPELRAAAQIVGGRLGRPVDLGLVSRHRDSSDVVWLLERICGYRC